MLDRDKKYSISRIFTSSFDNSSEAMGHYRKFWFKSSIYLKAAKELGIYDSMAITDKNKSIKAISYNQWQVIKDKSMEMLNDMLKSKSYIVAFNAQKSLDKRGFYIKVIDNYFNNISNKDSVKDRLIQCGEIINSKPKSGDKLYILHRIIKSDRTSATISNLSNMCHKYFGFKINTHTKNIKLLQKGFYNGFMKVTNEAIVLSMEQIVALAYIFENYEQFLRAKNTKRENNKGLIHNINRFIANPQSFDKYDVVYVENKVYKSLWL